MHTKVNKRVVLLIKKKHYVTIDVSNEKKKVISSIILFKNRVDNKLKYNSTNKLRIRH